jgi:hypothetical protein
MQGSTLSPFRLPTGELIFGRPKETYDSAIGQLLAELLGVEILSFALAFVLALSALWVLGG